MNPNLQYMPYFRKPDGFSTSFSSVFIIIWWFHRIPVPHDFSRFFELFTDEEYRIWKYIEKTLTWPDFCATILVERNERMELVTMNAVLALLVLIALLIRLMITKPSLRAESYALPCQYCQTCWWTFLNPAKAHGISASWMDKFLQSLLPSFSAAGFSIYLNQSYAAMKPFKQRRRFFHAV